MIISASRRTDIPAFYAKWFMNRLHARYCAVPNPMNAKQVAYVSLKPADVDAIVFWTRNPRPLMVHLPEIDQMGLKYYFQFTIMNNPRSIDTTGPDLERSLDTFRQLSESLGDPRRVVWRYDPIMLTSKTPVDFHLDTYAILAERLSGLTTRSIISIVDPYAKAVGRIRKLEQSGVEVSVVPERDPEFNRLITGISSLAAAHGFEIQSCAETLDLLPLGILPGKCVDDRYLKQIFDLDVTHKKDSGQRGACGCVQSRDIGMYDSCLFGCAYCYATSSFARAKQNYASHDPNSPSLLGHFDAHPTVKPESAQRQLKLL